MNKAAILNDIMGEIFRIRCHPRGALGIMEDHEIAAGFTLVPVGSDAPFFISPLDWDAACISLDGKRARIVLVHAKKEGCGAFHRLVANIIKAGFTPVVIEPLQQMADILQHWGWSCRQRGSGFDSYQEWTPPKQWRPS